MIKTHIPSCLLSTRFALLLSVFVHSIFISESFGQSGYQNGFIITQTQDTVYGELRSQSRSEYYNLCEFRAKGQVSHYGPSEIHGYGITGDRLFSSEIIKGQFVEVLVLSEISLFRNREQFLVKKQGQLHELKTPTKSKVYVEDNNTSGEMYKRDKSWLHTLSYLVGDCDLQWQDQLQLLDYNQKDLTKFIIQYNTCKDAEIFVPKGNKPWYEVSFGLSAGIINTEIQMHSVDQYYHPHISNSYSSTDPFLGLLVEIAAPRSFNRLSLQLETRIFKSTYQGFEEDTLDIPTNKNVHIASFGFTTISVPVSIKYSVPVGRNTLFLQLGGNYDHLIYKHSEKRSEFINDGVVQTLQGPAFEMRNNLVGIWTGLEYLHRFKNFSVGASARYNRLSNMVVQGQGEPQISSSGNRLSFSLIIKRP